MDSSQFADAEGSLLVSVRCLGLGISSKSPLPTAGLFSNLYVSMTKNPNVKNEKKYVKIEQTEHFPSHIKIQQQTQSVSSSASLKYKHIYTSEVFEDITDVFPSLLAKVKTVPGGYDSKLKLSVNYSSSLTSSKEIILAYQTFYESDLIRAVQQSSVYIVNLESEYCIASKAYVDIIQPLPALLNNSLFPVAALPGEKNPLVQNYVFYNEMDSITPYLDAKEQCWEPKFVAAIPTIFLTNLQNAIERSIQAWEKRHELERMRQGRFVNDQEAQLCGWNIIDINVKAARIGSTKATIDRINYIRSQQNAVSGKDNKDSKDSTGKDALSSGKENIVFLSQYPISEDYPDLTPLSTSSSSATTRLKVDSARQGRRTGNSAGNIGFKFLGSSNTKKVDESLPSTFVEVYIEDRSKTFVDLVGRTNTEYYTMYPVYGSNVNSSIVRKAHLTATTTNEVVQIVEEEHEYPFHVFESTNKQYIPRRWRFQNSYYNEANDVAEEPTHSFNSVSGKSTHFRKYISNCDLTFVRLDFCFETAGKKKCVGTAAVPVKMGEKVKTWVPIRSFTHTLEEQYAIYDNIEILVEVDVVASDADLLNSINDSMSDVYTYNRKIDGKVDFPKQIPKFEQHRMVIANCYEWMWQLGFTGHDPFILEGSDTGNSISDTVDEVAEVNNNTDSRKGESRASVSDEKKEADVIEIRKLYSADDLLSRNKASPTALSASPAASPSSSIRRKSRVKYVNKAAMPDSDDEFPSATTEYEDSAVHTSSQVSYETRKSVFDDVEDHHRVADDNGEEDELRNTIVHVNSVRLSEKTATAASPTLFDVPSPHDTVGRFDEIPSLSSSTALPLIKSICVKSRIDFVLSLDWIMNHIAELRKLLEEISKQYLPDLRRKIRNEKAFRSSALKKDPLMQPLPTNLHYQLLGIRKHCVACIDAHPKATEVIHSLSCGALTPHILGHKSGGLYQQESLLLQEKEKICELKDKYLQKLKHFGENGIRTDSEHSPYHVLQELGRAVESYETSCVLVGRRRMLAISQALTVAINALTLKLNLVIDEQIPQQMANRWLDSGFLIVFEGLLSVVGNERSMLEDTMSAVDSLRSYQVRILPNTYQGTEEESFSSTTSTAPQERGTSTSSRREASSEGLKISGRDALHQPTDNIVDIEFDMQGREILLFISEKAIGRLSEEFQLLIMRYELVLKFFPVLFSQGIDIQQTMVTTFGGDSTNKKRTMTSIDLQNYVNRMGFKNLNAYCFKTQPISGAKDVITHLDLKKEILASEYYNEQQQQQQQLHQNHAGKRTSGNFSSPVAKNRKNSTTIPMGSPAVSHRRASTGVIESEKTTLSSSYPGNSQLNHPHRPSQHTPLQPANSNEPAEQVGDIHPLAQNLYDSIRNSSLTMKNVDMLIEVERLTLILGGIRVTFCKSGKDRTGMAVTLEQARQLGERFSCGMSTIRLLKDANLMRVHGCRLMVAEKNIGKPVYSINILQAQFLPEMFRPPPQVCEDILKKDNS